jgi:hypothetical protein
VHFDKKKVFFSSSNGSVWILDKSHSTVIDPPRIIYSNPDGAPTALAVDWLFNHLYIAENDRIQRCDLDGLNCRPVVQPIDGRTKDIQVDPCNGYLFWLVYGARQGLFRADLADIPTFNHHDQPFLAKPINAFTLNSRDFRLYFLRSDDKMMSVYLNEINGDNPVEVHANTQKSGWQFVTGLAFHQGKFYWSRWNESPTASDRSLAIYGEQYREKLKLYYHSHLIFLNSINFIGGLRIWHPLSQPLPSECTDYSMY